MGESSVWLFVVERSSQLWVKTGEHIVLAGLSTVLAVLIGVPLGILAYRHKGIRGALLAAVGVLQTVPSLALLAFLLALLGKIGFIPSVIALTLYALLPIVRNTLTGLQGLSPAVIEASRGVGMTRGQRLWLVELPLATPIIIAGIRTAAVVSVGIATLCAFIGAGGLGDFIYRGLALRNKGLILLGAIPAAILALIVDGTIAASEWSIRVRTNPNESSWRARFKPVATFLPLLVILLGLLTNLWNPLARGDDRPVIRIASKDFSEQYIVGEMFAQLIEDRLKLTVERKFNMGGSMICHEALINGAVSMYPEYTGTALTTILKERSIASPAKSYALVSREYKKQFDVVWLPPFSLNNTWTLTVRRDVAEKRNWKTISDMAKKSSTLTAGFIPEFMERQDGYLGLQKTYGLNFKSVVDINSGLMYEAVKKGEVDVICGYGTDGRIPAYDLVILKDDKLFFPAYNLAPVVRQNVLERHPGIREALAPLCGRLDDATMQRLNFEVDEKKRSPAKVAREFLLEQGLLLTAE